jgi:hypothetical protein
MGATAGMGAEEEALMFMVIPVLITKRETAAMAQ